MLFRKHCNSALPLQQPIKISICFGAHVASLGDSGGIYSMFKVLNSHIHYLTKPAASIGPTMMQSSKKQPQGVMFGALQQQHTSMCPLCFGYIPTASSDNTLYTGYLQAFEKQVPAADLNSRTLLLCSYFVFTLVYTSRWCAQQLLHRPPRGANCTSRFRN